MVVAMMVMLMVEAMMVMLIVMTMGLPEDSQSGTMISISTATFSFQFEFLIFIIDLRSWLKLTTVPFICRIDAIIVAIADPDTNLLIFATFKNFRSTGLDWSEDTLTRRHKGRPRTETVRAGKGSLWEGRCHRHPHRYCHRQL